MQVKSPKIPEIFTGVRNEEVCHFYQGPVLRGFLSFTVDIAVHFFLIINRCKGYIAFGDPVQLNTENVHVVREESMRVTS